MRGSTPAPELSQTSARRSLRAKKNGRSRGRFFQSNTVVEADYFW
jgi:hypothetical protein